MGNLLTQHFTEGVSGVCTKAVTSSASFPLVILCVNIYLKAVFGLLVAFNAALQSDKVAQGASSTLA